MKYVPKSSCQLATIPSANQPFYRGLFSMRRPFILGASMLMLAPVGASAIDMQSPIDIRSEDAVFGVLPALEFDYGTVSMQAENLGSPDPIKTIEALDFHGGNHSLSVDGVTYSLLQFHFHNPAEHLVNGQQSAMEMHMVHQAPDDSLLVVGRLIEVGSENTALSPIFSALSTDLDTSGDHIDIASFDLANLLPSSLTSYRYDGSLTTPPFTEGVDWVVLSEVLTLSPTQIDAFGNLFPDGNTRDVQPLNDRMIRTDVVTAVPESFSTILGLSGAMLILVVGRSRFDYDNS